MESFIIILENCIIYRSQCFSYSNLYNNVTIAQNLVIFNFSIINKFVIINIKIKNHGKI